MIKTILISTLSLAFVTGAHAAEALRVSLSGKTEAAIKAELQAAARTVCARRPGTDYDACVLDSYNLAVVRFEKLKAAKVASLVF